MAITWTQADLDALKAAYVSGALRVQIGDREIIYRSQKDLLLAIQQVSEALSEPTESAAVIRLTYKRNNNNC